MAFQISRMSDKGERLAQFVAPGRKLGAVAYRKRICAEQREPDSTVQDLVNERTESKIPIRTGEMRKGGVTDAQRPKRDALLMKQIDDNIHNNIVTGRGTVTQVIHDGKTDTGDGELLDPRGPASVFHPPDNPGCSNRGR